jgi:hypothetical protein
MSVFRLKLHSVCADVEFLKEDSTRDSFQRDFAPFLSNDFSSTPSFTVKVGTVKPAKKSSFPFFSSPLFQSYGFFQRQCYWDAEHGFSIHTKPQLEFRVFGSNSDDLYEILFIILLSELGFQLEKKGFRRLHAVGWKFADKAYLLSMPSHHGKSGMASRMNAQDLPLLGDEVIFVKDGQAYGFPFRIALRSAPPAGVVGVKQWHRKFFGDKFLIEIKNGVTAPQEFAKIYFSHRKKILNNRLAFCGFVFLGLGIPQMREIMLRPQEVGALVKMAVARAVFALKLLASGKVQSIDHHEDLWLQLEDLKALPAAKKV